MNKKRKKVKKVCPICLSEDVVWDKAEKVYRCFWCKSEVI